MSELILATTETIAGHRVVSTLGLVDGAGRGALVAQARKLSANAIVGIRWSLSEEIEQVRNGPYEYSRRLKPLVYGTAVVIEPEAG